MKTPEANNNNNNNINPPTIKKPEERKKGVYKNFISGVKKIKK